MLQWMASLIGSQVVLPYANVRANYAVVASELRELIAAWSSVRL